MQIQGTEGTSTYDPAAGAQEQSVHAPSPFEYDDDDGSRPTLSRPELTRSSTTTSLTSEPSRSEPASDSAIASAIGGAMVCCLFYITYPPKLTSI